MPSSTQSSPLCPSLRHAALRYVVPLVLSSLGIVAPFTIGSATAQFTPDAPLTIAQTTPQVRDAIRLNQEGLDLVSQGDTAAAIERYQQALAIVRSLNERGGETIILRNLGNAYASAGQTQTAIDTYQQAIAVAQAIGQRSSEASALNNLGTAYLRLNQHDAALTAYQQSLAIVQAIGEHQGEGIILRNIGNLYTDIGQAQNALDTYQQAVAVARKSGDRATEVSALNDMGAAYASLGDPDAALTTFQQVLTIRRDTNDRQGEAITLNNMGNVYRTIGQLQQALDTFQQAGDIYRALDDRRGLMFVITNIAATHNALGQSDKALDLYTQALAISQDLKDQSVEASLLNNLGRTYNFLKQNQLALDYYLQSLPLLQALGDRRRESSTLSNIAATYDSLNQFQQAITFAQQALTISRELGDRPGEATILNNLGAFYGGQGESKTAIEYYRQSLPILQAIGKPIETGTTLGNIGQSYLDLKNYSAAETFFYDAVKLWEALRPGLTDQNKVSLFETQQYAYKNLQTSLVAQDKLDQALEVAERSRARAFVELLAEKQSPRDTVQTVRPISIAEIKQIAKEQQATLVEYSLINSRTLLIWVVKPSGEVAFSQVSLNQLPRENNIPPLQALIDNSRSSDLGVRGRGISFVEDVAAIQRATTQIQTSEANDRPHLQQLYSLLIQPIAAHLPTNPNDRVIFIPQGELFFVPFAALQSPQGRYLVEDHTIITSPAIQVLQLTRKQRLSLGDSDRSALLKNPLIVGNPTMPSIGNPPQQLSSLPGAETEAKAIAQLLNTQAILGKDATKAAIIAKMQTARLIHLATHGLLDDYKGLGVPGAIALAPTPGNTGPGNTGAINGLLTASEILDLTLNAELVVLSACDTGRGTITGDGVIGLSRSLLTAGAATVVVSLWKVPDDSTAFLMQQFYQSLQQPGVDKAQALRQAMLATLVQYPDPIDWAAFTLIGEAN